MYIGLDKAKFGLFGIIKAPRKASIPSKQPNPTTTTGIKPVYTPQEPDPVCAYPSGCVPKTRSAMRWGGGGGRDDVV